MANKKNKQSNSSLAISIAAIAAGMVMLAYASVPLYRLFCQITGFGGTTQIATKSPDIILDREITVTFNAEVDRNLPWKFTPEEPKVKLKIGENRLVIYDVENKSNEGVFGTATFNVTPHEAGRYFFKTQCFCYEKQHLEANQKVHLPVSFFIDPEIQNDKNLQNLTTITLSYTFFKVKDDGKL